MNLIPEKKDLSENRTILSFHPFHDAPPLNYRNQIILIYSLGRSIPPMIKLIRFATVEFHANLRASSLFPQHTPCTIDRFNACYTIPSPVSAADSLLKRNHPKTPVFRYRIVRCFEFAKFRTLLVFLALFLITNTPIWAIKNGFNSILLFTTRPHPKPGT
jgi:hypothetical protein